MLIYDRLVVQGGERSPAAEAAAAAAEALPAEAAALAEPPLAAAAAAENESSLDPAAPPVTDSKISRPSESCGPARHSKHPGSKEQAMCV